MRGHTPSTLAGDRAERYFLFRVPRPSSFYLLLRHRDGECFGRCVVAMIGRGHGDKRCTNREETSRWRIRRRRNVPVLRINRGGRKVNVSAFLTVDLFLLR